RHDIDLTLMGAFSHSRIRGFLVGSFTAKMMAKTQRPLQLLR
ncbi:MAG: universal stress protein UspA, partial [Gammaproteobacteria bacterium HGW-Gammaproteobacteria-7]